MVERLDGLAATSPPPREKSPTLTFALVSMETLSVPGTVSASARVSWTWAKMASVWGTFFADGP